MVRGSSTIEPLISEIAKRYEIENPHVQIEVQAGGSNKGLVAARQRNADIVMVSRSLTTNDGDLQVFPIAKDGISIVLNDENTVSQLTPEQVIAVYTDEINNWQDLGGADAPIFVLNKSEDHGTFDLFKQFFEFENLEIHADQIVGDNEEVIEAVQSIPNAIGYVSIGTAEYEIVHGASLKLLPINGVLATIANVDNDQFPLTRLLYLVTVSSPTGLTEDFITYAQSGEVKDLVKEQSFIPLSDE